MPPSRRRKGRASPLAALALASALASPAAAQTPQDKQQADQLFKDGREFVKTGRYAEACPMFKESQRLDPTLAARCNIAVVCHQITGQTGTAWGMLEEVEREARADPAKKQSLKCAQDAMEALRPDLALVTLDTRAVAGTPGLAVTRDQVAVPASQWGKPLAMDPGEHVVEVTAPGRKPWRGTVQATAKATFVLTIPSLEPDHTADPSAPPSPSPLPPSPPDARPRWTTLHTSAVAATAVGGAGLLAGVIAGLVSLARGKAADCAGGVCPTQAALDASHSAYAAGNAATAGFAVGGAGAAAAMVLWILAPARQPGRAAAARYGVVVGPRGLSLRGAW